MPSNRPRMGAAAATICAALLASVSSALIVPRQSAFGVGNCIPSTAAFDAVAKQKQKYGAGAWGLALLANRETNNPLTQVQAYEGRGEGRGGGRGGGGRNYQGRGGRGGGRGRGGRGGRGRGGRGGRGYPDGEGPPTLKLANPLQVQRITLERPERPPQQENGSRGGGRGGRSGRGDGGGRGGRDGGRGGGRGGVVASATDSGTKFGGGGGGGVEVDVRPGAGVGRGRKAPARKKGAPGRGEDGPRRQRVNLRIGTGKKGRQAQRSQKRGSLKKRDRRAEKERKEEAAIERRTVSLSDEPITVSQLAEIIDQTPVSVIKFLMTDLGVMASMTQMVDPATQVAVAEGFGKVVGGDEDWDEDEDDEIDEDSALAVGFIVDEDDPEDLKPRPPVVTIMGHVDHGKTSLLDTIRKSNVVEGEAGGITQAIDAYQVKHNGQTISFIDTPGHAAFTDMRERGANITDIVVLVVAADDSVMQQTADSIACARQAGVPLIVAVNKCDLETADPNRVKSDLTQYDVLTEDLGGDVLCAEISAKAGTGIDDLLDKIMLQAEIQDLKANPDRDAQGVVIEARVEKGLGTVATSLIQRGTLKVGDIFVAGSTNGKVRALIDTDGKTRLKEAGPSTPVNIVGFDGVPNAGDMIVVAEDEQTARELATSRERIQREKAGDSYQVDLMHSITQNIFSGEAMKERREMCVVVKADVQGSAEALTRALSELKLEDDEAIVTIKVLISEAGEVSKSDIAVASVTPDTTVIAFNVAANFAAQEDARMAGVPIEYYSIIYDAIESVESRMQEVLSPTPEGEYVGAALVQEVFNIGGTGNIAGSRCTDGMIKKGSNVRVMRGDKILTESKVRTLRNFKSEVDSIQEGDECGIGLLDYEDFEPGDVIESYVENKK